MTWRGAALTGLQILFWLCGLCFGAPVFYACAAAALLMLLYGGITLRLFASGLHTELFARPDSIPRGGHAVCIAEFTCGFHLPVGPLSLRITIGEKHCAHTFVMNRGRNYAADCETPTEHVGTLLCSVEELRLTDLFGLWSIARPTGSLQVHITVLPLDYPLEPLRFFGTEDGVPLPNRTVEDLTSSVDTRSYRSGDALKRIHWKLSARRRDLIVRQFETPAPPATCILMDTELPGVRDEERSALLWDALCETTYSAALMQIGGGHPVILPLYSAQGLQVLNGARPELIRSRLAQLPRGRSTADFATILNAELKRMRTIGSVVIITACLSARLTEGVRRIRRMGPSVRVYYTADTPTDEATERCINSLLGCMVEVCCVTPSV